MVIIIRTCMAILDYQELLEELNNLIKTKRKLTVSELKEWASLKRIGYLTLSLLLEDLKESMKDSLFFSEEKVLIDEILEIYIPNEIKYSPTRFQEEPLRIDIQPKPRFKKSKNVKESRVKRKELRKRSSTSILDFLGQNKISEGSEHKEETIAVEKQEEKEYELGNISPVSEEETPIRELADNKDMEIALSYLAKYWSVGEIRFIQDLRRMGVRNPRDVINKIIEKGYAERVDIGIINAKEILRKYKITIPLADIFG